MADDQAKINIIVSRELKLRIKKAITNNNIESMQEGYVYMISAGLEKMEEKNNGGK